MYTLQNGVQKGMSEKAQSLELSKGSTVRRLRVQNPQGLHARPAASIVRLLRNSQSSVTFTYKKQTVDAHSILGLLMLAAPKNAWITVSVAGPDAVDTLERLTEAFQQQFGEITSD